MLLPLGRKTRVRIRTGGWKGGGVLKGENVADIAGILLTKLLISNSVTDVAGLLPICCRLSC